ncbi:tir chaperone, partial [Escherichia coli 95.0183]
YAGR